MDEQSKRDINKGKKFVIFGFITIGILFLVYSRYQNPELLTPDVIESVQRIAYGFYIALILSLIHI